MRSRDARISALVDLGICALNELLATQDFGGHENELAGHKIPVLVNHDGRPSPSKRRGFFVGGL